MSRYRGEVPVIVWVILYFMVIGIGLGIFLAQKEAAERITVPARVSSDPIYREKIPAQYHAVVDRISGEYQFSYKLIYRLVNHESRWNRWALGVNTNGTEDRGLCQINSGNLWEGDPWNPEENLMTGFKYLRHLHDRFGSVENALMAYNGGPGRMARGEVPEASRRYAVAILE